MTKPIDKRVYKGTFPTCHDFNTLLVSPDSVRLLVGFTAGQVQLIDPIKKELSKLYNEEVCHTHLYMGHVKRIWYLTPMRAAKVQASLRIRAISPEPPLLAHTSSESRGTFRQKARSLVPLNGWACAVKICHDRMLEDTNSLDGAHTVKVVNIGHLKLSL